LILYLRIADGTIAAAKYQTYGCGATIAGGSVLTEMISGRSVAECAALTERDVIEALDGVPANKLHGPALAIAALRDALKGWESVFVATDETRISRLNRGLEPRNTRKIRNKREWKGEPIEEIDEA
jgi:NifU-like protein involved in Fe-S cluster formation